MDSDKEDSFESQGRESEEIDVWEPVITKAEDANIQLPRDYTAYRTIDVEEVKAWMSVWIAIQQELMRQKITQHLMGLYTISYIVGLADFVFTRNTWLLTASGLLPLLTFLLRWIVGYWFQRPKK